VLRGLESAGRMWGVSCCRNKSYHRKQVVEENRDRETEGSLGRE
jgi:hypothetical protein